MSSSPSGDPVILDSPLLIAPRLTPGDRVADRYLIVSTIGEGGFGVVYLAVQESVQRYVALKTLLPRDLTPGVAARLAQEFHREALHTSRLAHPNTITLFDYGETDAGLRYLVTEFLDGDSLATFLHRRRNLPPSLVMHLVTQIAQSLAEAHKLGIVHGDLKPDNIFVCDTWGDAHFIKVLDFGIARMIGDANPAGMGTPRYMSPEQVCGDPLLPGSDIYALGLMAYEMLTGLCSSDIFKTSVGGDAQGSVTPEWSGLPFALDHLGWGELLRRATHADAAQRYADGADFLKALKTLRNSHDSMDEGFFEDPSSSSSLQPLSSNEGFRSVDPLFTANSMAESTLVSRILRASDRALFLRWLQEMRNEQRGRLILLGGERGQGKSLCAGWLLEQGQSMGLATGQGDCGPENPMYGLAEALARSLGCTAKIEGAWPIHMLETRTQAVLGRILRPSEMVLLMTAFGWTRESDQDKFAEDFARFLITLSNARPMVLVLHNLESASPLTLACLDHLSWRMESNCSLLILGTVCRDLLPERDFALSAFENLSARTCLESHSLEALPETEQISLLRDLMATALDQHDIQAQPSPDLLALMMRLGHGNPRALDELSRYVVTSNLLMPTSQGLILRPEVDHQHLMPPNLTSFLEERLLTRLIRHPEQGPLLRLLVLRCALLGASFSQSLLVQLLAMEANAGHPCAAQVMEHLAELLITLVQEDILIQDQASFEGLCWSFTQPLMRRLLAKRAAHLPDAAPLHRLTAMAKTSFHELRGELRLHRREIERHENRASAPRSSHTPPGWENHRACWRHK